MPSVGLFRWHWRDSAYSYKCYRGLVCRSLAVVNWCPLWRTLWIGSKEGNPDFYASAFFLLSFVDLQMHIVIIFVLITSVVVYFCSLFPADPTYLDVFKTRVHSILCHLLNLITDYYFGSSSPSIIGTVEWRCLISWWLDVITLSLYFVWVGNVCSCMFVHIWPRGQTWHWNTIACVSTEFIYQASGHRCDTFIISLWFWHFV